MNVRTLSNMKKIIRNQIEGRFVPSREKLITNLDPPRDGWIRTMRHALGMTVRELAQRMQVSPSRITELEKAERNENTTLKSMKRAAKALNCKFVYGLVPIEPLEQIVQHQAIKIAKEQLKQVDQTMRLERQQVSPRFMKQQFERLVEEFVRKPPREFWKPK